MLRALINNKGICPFPKSVNGLVSMETGEWGWDQFGMEGINVFLVLVLGIASSGSVFSH